MVGGMIECFEEIGMEGTLARSIFSAVLEGHSGSSVE